MFNLSIGAIFRSENSWLQEWIDYHHAIGVEHFYLFNHDEDRHVSDRILQRYIDRNLVDNFHVLDIPHLSRLAADSLMKTVYSDLVKMTRDQTQWLALIDLDEFILPHQNDDLREVLEDYREHSGLAVNWQIFGTSGYIKRPETQIRHLVHRADTDWNPNRFFKTIVKPDLVILEEIYDVHHFPCETGRTVNENHEPVVGLTHGISTNIIQLNHYILRSWQDYWEVKAQRQRFNGASPCDEEYFLFHDRNEIFDDEISVRFGHCIQ